MHLLSVVQFVNDQQQFNYGCPRLQSEDFFGRIEHLHKGLAAAFLDTAGKRA
jgi:hypothetical protein